MNVQHVPTEQVQRVWPDVANFFALALCKHGACDGYTMDQIRTLVALGQWLLIVAHDEGKIIGALTVNFTNRPSQRVAFVTCIGGRGLAEPSAYAQLVEVLKYFGATHIEGAVDEAVARLWRKVGLTEKYTIVGAEL